MRVMAIDYGDAHTGVALSDPTGLLTGVTRTMFGLTFFAVLSISSRRPAAAWWSRSPRIAAVITPFFNSIRRFILSSFLFFWGGARSVRTVFAFGECHAAQRRAAARTRRLLKSKTENKKDGPL